MAKATKKVEQTDDQRTLDLIEKVKLKRAEIARLDNPKYKTNCSFSFSESGKDPLNLQVESNVMKLIHMIGFLQTQLASYVSAVEKLQITDAPEFRWLSFTVADWVEDIQTRIGKIRIAAKRVELTKFEALLESIISPELRRKMILDEVSGSIE